MERFEELTVQMKANEGTGTPMPEYQSHKKVWALKIKEVVPAPKPTIDELDRILNGDGVTDTGAVIVPEGHFGPLPVTRDFVSKHDPQAGGYLVFYKDGYQSFSPAAAFEEGYTLLP